MKPISIFVIAMHALLLTWMALWLPAKKKEYRPMTIRTIVEASSPPAPSMPTSSTRMQQPPKVAAKQTLPPPRPKPKKIEPQKNPVQKQKNPVVPNALWKQLEESIAKIEGKGHKEMPKNKASSSSRIPKLNVDSIGEGKEGTYATTLIHYLQSKLELPEMGAVKIELTLKNDGTFVHMRFLESASSPNQKFLENELRYLKYPIFSGPLKEKKEHTFVITFCNS